MPDFLTFLGFTSIFIATATMVSCTLITASSAEKYKKIIAEKEKQIKAQAKQIESLLEAKNHLKETTNPNVDDLPKNNDVVFYDDVENMIGSVITGQAEEESLVHFLKRLIPNKPVTAISLKSEKEVKTYGYLSENGISRLKERDFTEELVKRSDLRNLEMDLRSEILIQKMEVSKWKEAYESAPSQAHFDILAETLSECKAIADGHHEQTLKQVIDGCIEELQQISEKKIDSQKILN